MNQSLERGIDRTSAPIGGRGNAQLRVCALERQYWDWRTPRPALF